MSEHLDINQPVSVAAQRLHDAGVAYRVAEWSERESRDECSRRIADAQHAVLEAERTMAQAQYELADARIAARTNNAAAKQALQDAKEALHVAQHNHRHDH